MTAADASPTATRELLGIVVVNYGSHDLIAENLSWAEPNDGSPIQVVIVNNFRTAVDRSEIAALVDRKGWALVDSAQNLGFGSAVNLGAERAWALGCASVVVLNPDVAIVASQIEALRVASVEQPWALTSPLILGPDGRPWARLGLIDTRRGRLWTDGGRDDLGWLSGACLCVRKDLWIALGGFDDDYFLYWEDVDLSYRCLQQSGKLILRDDVVVRHDIGGTQTESVGKSSAYFFYNCRNRLIFAAKRLGPLDRLRWLLLTPADARRVVNRGLPQSRLAKLRTAVLPALAGCLAGLAWLVVPAPAARFLGARRVRRLRRGAGRRSGEAARSVVSNVKDRLASRKEQRASTHPVGGA